MKYLLQLSIMLCLSIQALAQPTFTAADMMAVGDKYTLYDADTNITEGVSGANTTWNFAILNIKSTFQMHNIVKPDDTPSAASFRNATACDKTDSSYNYFQVADDFRYHGFSTVQASALVSYTNPAIMFAFPLTFNSAMYDVFSGSFTYGALMGQRSGTIRTTADAWGTLVLPSGTFANTLRTKIEQDFTDSVPNIFNIKTKVTTYQWMAPGFKYPILTINYINNRRTITVTKSAGGTAIDNELAGNQIHLYPNPAQNSTLLSYTLNSPARVQISLYNSLGSVIASVAKQSQPAGNHQTEIPLADLPKGLYFAKITVADKVFTKSIVKE